MKYAVAVNEATSIIDDALRNPKPGCDDAPPVALQRDIKAYPTAFVEGDVIFYSDDIGAQPYLVPYMTMYFFAPEIDVNNMTLSDIDGAIARVKTDENGSFRAVFTKEQFAMKLGIVLVREDPNTGEEEILIRENAGEAIQQSSKNDETVRSFEDASGILQITFELQSVAK